jgi:uncharacterized OsmC-like protein
MDVVLNSSEDLEITNFNSNGINITTKDETAYYSALQMFAVSLSLCTYSVLYSYSEQIDAPVDDLSVHIRWSYAEKPFRIDKIDMDIHWPALPESRLEAAQRAASMCTLHHTLEHPPKVITTVRH